MATLLEMKQKSTKENMKIMQAWLDGKIILARNTDVSWEWQQIKYPSWDFAHVEYKILEEDDVSKAA